jgi:hypothetical protein
MSAGLLSPVPGTSFQMLQKQTWTDIVKGAARDIFGDLLSAARAENAVLAKELTFECATLRLGYSH